MKGISHQFLKSISSLFYWIDGEILFLDIHTPYVPNSAQNGNQGSKWAYFLQRRIFMTGLNGAFLSIFFRISLDWAYNWK